MSKLKYKSEKEKNDYKNQVRILNFKNAIMEK